MQIYERINYFLEHKKITKKELANKLLAMDVKLKSTGDIPSEKAIYAYLSGL